MKKGDKFEIQTDTLYRNFMNIYIPLKNHERDIVYDNGARELAALR